LPITNKHKFECWGILTNFWSLKFVNVKAKQKYSEQIYTRAACTYMAAVSISHKDLELSI
jgi:hypothetical protein